MELRTYTTRQVCVFAHYVRPGETDTMNRKNNEGKPIVRFTDSTGSLIREYLAETILGTTPDMAFALDITAGFVIGPHEMDEVREWVFNCEPLEAVVQAPGWRVCDAGRDYVEAEMFIRHGDDQYRAILTLERETDTFSGPYWSRSEGPGEPFRGIDNLDVPLAVRGECFATQAAGRILLRGRRDEDLPARVSIVPTWRGILPLLVEAAANGTTASARRTAMEELYRLADTVDAMNAGASE